MTDESDPYQKLVEAIEALKHALGFLKKAEKDPFYFSGIAKSFETCFEYTWKAFKRRATEEGFEVYSPKDAIKQAGQLGLIDNVEQWLNFLQDRNLAVHDYLGLSDEDYLKTIQFFFHDVQRVIRRLKSSQKT